MYYCASKPLLCVIEMMTSLNKKAKIVFLATVIILLPVSSSTQKEEENIDYEESGLHNCRSSPLSDKRSTKLFPRENGFAEAIPCVEPRRFSSPSD
jgi:hypothetical protein